MGGAEEEEREGGRRSGEEVGFLCESFVFPEPWQRCAVAKGVLKL